MNKNRILYCTVLFEKKKAYGLTLNEYVFLDMVFHLSSKTGWCYSSKEYFAETLDLSRQSIFNLIKKLIDTGWLEKDGASANLRTAEKWNQVYTEESKYDTGSKDSLLHSQKTLQDSKDSLQDSKETLLNNNNIYKDNKNIEDSMSDKPNKNSIISEIIEYLNLKTGQNYRANTPKTKELINARLKEKFTLDDFKAVIDKKSNEWGNDPRMSPYLRPVTLFSTKFESYLNQKGSYGNNNKPKSTNSRSNSYSIEELDREVQENWGTIFAEATKHCGASEAADFREQP